MENSDDLFEYAQRRFDHESARRQLREKYESRMIFAHAGGLWRAGPDLVVLLNSFDQNIDMVLEDLYHNPVKVQRSELLMLAQQRWQEQMNAWLVEYDTICQQR